jgi:hypothetical protein
MMKLSKLSLDVIWDIIGEPDVKKKISSEIYSTEKRLVRLANLGQLESSINEEIRKIEVLNIAQGLVDKLTEETQASFLSDLGECKYAYQMGKVIEKIIRKKRRFKMSLEKNLQKILEALCDKSRRLCLCLHALRGI